MMRFVWPPYRVRWDHPDTSGGPGAEIITRQPREENTVWNRASGLIEPD